MSYSDVLSQLWAAFCRKRPVLLTKGVLFNMTMPDHIERSCPKRQSHFTVFLSSLVQQLRPSSPIRFAAMKSHLASTHFANDDDVKHAMRTSLSLQSTKTYAAGIEALKKKRRKTCIHVVEDYVEKKIIFHKHICNTAPLINMCNLFRCTDSFVHIITFIQNPTMGRTSFIPLY